MPQLSEQELTELYAAAITEVDARFRLPGIDNLLTAPTTLEKQVAIFDALAEINSAPPETQYLLENVLAFDGDPRVKSLLYLGTGKNIIRTLLADWTANGFTLNLEEFNIEDRLSRYESLLSLIQTQFTDQLTNYKTATGKFVKRIHVGDNNPLIRFRNRGQGYAGMAARWR